MVDANALEHAFTDAVNFYTIDYERWVHFHSLDTYLKEFGTEDRYETFRYWALENRCQDYIPLSIHRELLVAFEKLLGWSHQKITSERVEQFICWSLSVATEKHLYNCHICRKASPNPRLIALNSRRPSCRSFSVRLYDLYSNAIKNGDDCMNRVIAHAVRNLKDDLDLAVRYLIHTLDDLPKGSVSLPIDVELEPVEWRENQTDNIPKADIVKIQNGQTLGHIREFIDGRWLAQAYVPPTNSKYARTKEDAVNWLVEECTELVTVSVDGGPRTTKRAMSPVSLSTYQSGDDTWSPYEIAFADNAHGLSEGQHIVIRGGGTMHIGIADGIVSLVNGGSVEFGN